MTRQELSETIVAMTHCIDEYILIHNIEYEVSELAPSRYSHMRQYRDEYGHFLVSDVGDHGLLGKEYNVKFRACHDHGHYTQELDFSVQDEIELSDQSMFEFRTIAKDLGYSSNIADNVARFIDCEVRQQRLYYAETGEYVKDQVEFTISKLVD